MTKLKMETQLSLIEIEKMKEFLNHWKVKRAIETTQLMDNETQPARYNISTFLNDLNSLKGVEDE